MTKEGSLAWKGHFLPRHLQSGSVGFSDTSPPPESGLSIGSGEARLHVEARRGEAVLPSPRDRRSDKPAMISNDRH